jgi:hypothetical protein
MEAAASPTVRIAALDWQWDSRRGASDLAFVGSAGGRWTAELAVLAADSLDAVLRTPSQARDEIANAMPVEGPHRLEMVAERHDQPLQSEG